MSCDTIFLDEEDENNKIENKAASIIYNDIYKKLIDLKEKKQDIINSVNMTFSKLIEKYELKK